MFSRVTGRSRAQARQAARVLNQRPGRVAAEEVRILISTVGDLIERLGVVVNPELEPLRKRTEAALAAAKSAIVDGSQQVRGQAQEFADQGAAYVRDRPWTSFGLTALCVLAIGLWAGRAMTKH